LSLETTLLRPPATPPAAPPPAAPPPAASTALEVRPAALVNAANREFLAFRVGAEEYAIDILQVQEIRSYEAPTRIAQAGASVAGVLNLRGVIVPIVDLRTHLGSPALFDAATVTVVLNLRGRTVGAIVDAVCDVIELGSHAICPAPALAGNEVTGAIAGIGTVQQGEHRRMLILIDIERLVGQIDTGLVDPTAH